MHKQPGPRMTLSTQLVLRVLLAEPSQEMYGLEICEAAGLPSGTIHPILARLERLGGWNPAGKMPALRRKAAPAAAITPGARTAPNALASLWPRPLPPSAPSDYAPGQPEA